MLRKNFDKLIVSPDVQFAEYAPLKDAKITLIWYLFLAKGALCEFIDCFSQIDINGQSGVRALGNNLKADEAVKKDTENIASTNRNKRQHNNSVNAFWQY